MNLSRFFPKRTRPPSHEPHRWATLVWALWAALSGYSIVSGSLVPEALAAFFALELAGVVLERQTAFGFTFSELVWWYVPWLPARWALAVVYGTAFSVYVSPVAGAILALWLVPHFVAVGRDFRRYENRVAALAARAYIRDDGVYPSSVDYLVETTGEDPELVRDAQRLYVRLEQQDRAAWRTIADSGAFMESLDELER